MSVDGCFLKPKTANLFEKAIAESWKSSTLAYFFEKKILLIKVIIND